MAELKPIAVILVVLCLLNCVKCSSWDSYIDNLIGQSRDASGNTHVDKAAIFGLDGGTPYTSTSGDKMLRLSQTERTTISKVFKSRNFDDFMQNGVNVDGVRYQFLREEDDRVFAKRKNHGAITIQVSKTAVVIAHCPEGSQQGNANKAVNVIAEYLSSLGL